MSFYLERDEYEYVKIRCLLVDVYVAAYACWCMTHNKGC